MALDTIVLENKAAADSAGSTTTSLDVDITSLGEVVGDVLVGLAMSDSNSATQSMTPPTDWTEIANRSNSSNDCSVNLSFLVVVGDEGNTVSFPSSPANNMVAFVWRLSGVDLTTVEDTTHVEQGRNSNANVPITVLTTITDGALAFFGRTFDGGDGFPFSIQDVGNWEEEDERQDGTGAANACGHTGILPMPTAGNTNSGNNSVASVSDGGGIIVTALRPATLAVGGLPPFMLRHNQHNTLLRM